MHLTPDVTSNGYIKSTFLKRMCPQCILALVFEEDLIFSCLLALQKTLFFIFQLCLWKQGILEIPLKNRAGSTYTRTYPRSSSGERYHLVATYSV